MALNQTFNQDGVANIGIAALVSTTAPALTAGTYAAFSLTLAGGLRVDGSGVTQPISATTLPLPTGAAAAIQLPATLGAKTGANSLSIVPATDAIFATTLPTSASATLTSVASSITSVTLLTASASTKGWVIFNDSTSVLYVAFGATATSSAYTSKLFPNAQLTSELTYTGIISGIWAAANGSARVTQLT